MRKCILENEQKFYFHSVYKNYAAGKNGEIMNVRLKKKTFKGILQMVVT